MYQGKKHFEQLVTRYLNGQLGDHEYDQLLGLLQDQEKSSWFYLLKNRWDPEKDDRSRKNWTRLARRIKVNSTENTKSKKQVIGQQWIFRVAAILIIGLLITTSVLYRKNQGFIRGITIIETPRGEKSRIYLPDGTEVWLNASSKLSYNFFSKESRRVSLTGEAFFKVKRNERSPFTVKTSRCAVEVLGTEFNVMAYDQLKRNEITLFKGKVDVKAAKKSAILHVGDKLLISNDTIRMQKANLDQTYGWVENKFNFSKISLDELIMRLENWYDVDIECDNADEKNITLSGTFKNEETIWQVLDAINVYLPILYEKTDTRKIKFMVK
jgi:ferric-dicitrate binding protein FerR (iron transport regulator)